MAVDLRLDIGSAKEFLKNGWIQFSSRIPCNP